MSTSNYYEVLARDCWSQYAAAIEERRNQQRNGCQRHRRPMTYPPRPLPVVPVHQWRESEARRRFDEQFRQFDRGAAKAWQRIIPSPEEIANWTIKRAERYRRARRPHRKGRLRVIAVEQSRIELEARKSVANLVRGNEVGVQVGTLPITKGNNRVRFLFENVNSLCLWEKGRHRRRKIRRLRRLMEEFGVDVFSLCELQTDWRFVQPQDRFANLFAVGKQKRHVFAHNVAEEKSVRSQFGGTAMMAVDQFAARVQSVGKDPRDLGRYCWMEVGGGGKTTVLLTVYSPSASQDSEEGKTVYEQHKRVLEGNGIARCPIKVLQEDVAAQLTTWKEEGKEIIAMGDFNSNVYSAEWS